MQPSTDQAHRDAAEDARWSRPECQVWTGTLLLGTCLLYCVRVTMPVCAVAMSQDFGWDKKEAGMVLSSFFWGYCLTQVVGGHLGDRIGGEKVILLSATTWGFVTVATPMLAHLSNARLVSMAFSRVLTGLLQGVYFPALTSLLSQRVPEGQRAFACSMVGAGSQFGTLVTGAVGSLLLDWCGWQSVFYFSGGLALLWVCYVYRFLLNEQDLIPALGVLVQGPPLAGAPKVPWRQLFWKPSVWAAICSQLSSACAFFILLSWLPTFFKETFPHSKATSESSSSLQGWIFNVVPWLAAIPASLFSGFLSDHLVSQGCRAITVRKFMQVGEHHTYLLWTSLFRCVSWVMFPSHLISETRPGPKSWAEKAEVQQGAASQPHCLRPADSQTWAGSSQGRAHQRWSCPGWFRAQRVAGVSGSWLTLDLSLSSTRAPCAPSGFQAEIIGVHLVSPPQGGPSPAAAAQCMRVPCALPQPSRPQVVGLGLSSLFTLCLGHTSSFLKAVVFASASIGLQTFNHSGISVNIQDLAPSCAGFLFGEGAAYPSCGVANTAGALAGVVGVCLSGYLIEATGSWTCMFTLVAIISNLGLGAFLVFGQAQRVDLNPAREDL
ncbi:solute carrier family 17 member 9 isoform X2 [Fukomys damarensis]|uniref:solute carrier family 17 member 9 isoform X2 n=1 Tax=Fukomys damarensis TaxID=885580 RepID=UPI00053FCDA7|nr:solute carrier family 17 member 9 isoform X2 [Fukomys damarensis]